MSDSDEDIPLAQLKTVIEDDIPLIRLRQTREISDDLDIGFTSESGSGEYDSDRDPEFNLGRCEVERCRKEVWAACHMCEILVCWDHFMETISSCSQHGKTVNTKKRKRQPKSKETVEQIPNEDHGSQIDELVQTPNEGNSHPIDTPVQTLSTVTLPEQFTVEGIARETPIKKTRKQNKQKQAKAKRNKGEEYISPKTKKKVPAKEMKARCKGSSKCHRDCDKITDEERKEIFNNFYAYADLRLQREFIVRHIKTCSVSRKKNKDGPSRRGITKHYFLTVNGQQTHVCQTFFLNTLSISEQTARTAISKMTQAGTIEAEKRGGQSERVTARNESIKEEVMTHINRFPRVESHFCRATTTKEYLSPDLTVQKMYAMFCKERDQNDSKPPSFRFYNNTFKEMNLSIHRPKKDQCSLCMVVNEKGNGSMISEEVAVRYEQHIAEKKKVRELKDQSKEMAEKDKKIRCATFDLQQVIYLPRSLENAIFYKRRLSNFNLTFYDITDKMCHCFTWHEGVSKRGSSEISSCVYKALQYYDNDGVRDVYLYADGCSGQNKNSIFPAMMLYAVNNSKNLEHISLRYFESFHGQNEGDCVHSSISTAMKRAGNLYVPSQLLPVFNLARRNNVVHQLQYDDFTDFKLLSKDLRILRSRKETVNWNTIMELKVNSKNPQKIFYKTSHSAKVYSEIELDRRNASFVKSYELKKLNSEPNKISKDKFQDLFALCSGDTPVVRNQEHRDFYFNLPH